MVFARVKGTMDFFPEDKDCQDRIFDLLRRTAKRSGFREVEAPALESISLLTAKSGDEIKSQIFTLEKRSKEKLGLRFEFTASLARMFIDRQKSLQKPVKWFSLGRMWRYEQPQAGRQREFYQFNPEIFGSDKPESDAEVVGLAIQALKALGLTKNDFYVKINNRKLLQGLLLNIIPKTRLEDVMRTIDKKEKLTEKEFLSELSFVGNVKASQIKKMLTLDFGDLKKLKLNKTAKEGFSELQKVCELLPKDFVRFDISTARGLAYYTGTVFEIYDSRNKYRAICGGGRYDEMIELFGGESTPATGFAMGYSPLSLLLKEKGLLPKAVAGPDYYIAIVKQEVTKDAIGLAARLRKQYSVDIDLMRRNLGNQLKYANSIGAKKVIFVGPDELKKKAVKVKDMDSGVEKTVKIKSLI